MFSKSIRHIKECCFLVACAGFGLFSQLVVSLFGVVRGHIIEEGEAINQHTCCAANQT